VSVLCRASLPVGIKINVGPRNRAPSQRRSASMFPRPYSRAQTPQCSGLLLHVLVKHWQQGQNSSTILKPIHLRESFARAR